MNYCGGFNNDEHLKHHLKKIYLMKHLFFNNFIIGLILMVLIWLFVMFSGGTLELWSEKMYNITAYDCRKIFLVLMGIWKLFLVQFALVPFIALALIEGMLKKHIKSE